MKKLLLTSAILAILFSSCGYESKEFKALKAKNDSILAVQEQQIAEMNEYMALVQEIDNGFSAIKQSQDMLSISSSYEGQPNESLRTRFTNDLNTINQILADNKSKIADLEKKVESGKFQSSELRRTVNRLTETLNQKNQELEALSAVLAKKDITIDSLVVETQALLRKTADLEMEKNVNLQEIAKQDADLNRVYYKLATRKEIKDSNIDIDKMKSTIRNGMFTAADKRELDAVEINSKRARVLTKHPVSSYELRQKADKTYTLIIKNHTDFWSMSKYLLVRID